MMEESLSKSNYLTTFLIKNRWFWHFGFWLGFIAFRARSYYSTFVDYMEYLNFMLIRDLLFFVAFVYLTILFYKKLVYKKKHLLFFVIGTSLSGLYLFLVLELQQHLVPSIRAMKDVNFNEWYLDNLPFTICMFIIVSFSKYFKDSFISQYYENEQKQIKLKLELDNLKAQISPHFLFNTMNNFYGLAVDKSNKLPNLMIRLSDLLRYSLYETQNDLVPLSKEINYLRDYIELEKIRLESTLNLEFEASPIVKDNIGIAPLILMVFIENAFKHARQVLNEPVEIKIRVLLKEEKTLILNVKNNYYDQGGNYQGGLGLLNVKKRLELLYPGNFHTLEIMRDKKFYNVTLTLQLNDIHS